MKILISGSSGLVGSALIDFLKKEHDEIYKLVHAKADLNRDEIEWDTEKGVINPPLLEGFDVVIHLAGENIMGRWSTSKKEKIRNSRVKGTLSLCKNLSELDDPPSLFICASAVGFYGNQGDRFITEKTGKGEGFLSDVCQEWEQATSNIASKGIRTANLRFGMVLSPKGGALKSLLPIFKLGLGGKIGSGKQYMSWISIDDLVRAIDYIIKDEHLAGAVNIVSPNPIRNKDFTKILGSVLHRPTFFSIPAFLVRWLFGEMGDELLLTSQKVRPQKLIEEGFYFQHPYLEKALQSMLKK